MHVQTHSYRHDQKTSSQVLQCQNFQGMAAGTDADSDQTHQHAKQHCCWGLRSQTQQTWLHHIPLLLLLPLAWLVQPSHSAYKTGEVSWPQHVAELPNDSGVHQGLGTGSGSLAAQQQPHCCCC
jgi:hypothetical protein